MADRVMRHSRVVRLLVHRRGVFRLLVGGTTLVLLGQEFLDLPVVLLNTDGKLEVFTGDGVPVLFLDKLARAERLGKSGAN